MLRRASVLVGLSFDAGPALPLRASNKSARGTGVSEMWNNHQGYLPVHGCRRWRVAFWLRRKPSSLPWNHHLIRRNNHEYRRRPRVGEDNATTLSETGSTPPPPTSVERKVSLMVFHISLTPGAPAPICSMPAAEAAGTASRKGPTRHLHAVACEGFLYRITEENVQHEPKCG